MRTKFLERTNCSSWARSDGHETTSFTGAWSPWYQARPLCAQFSKRRPSKFSMQSPNHSALWHARGVHHWNIFEGCALCRNEHGQSVKWLSLHNAAYHNAGPVRYACSSFFHSWRASLWVALRVWQLLVRAHTTRHCYGFATFLCVIIITKLNRGVMCELTDNASQFNLLVMCAHVANSSRRRTMELRR